MYIICTLYNLDKYVRMYIHVHVNAYALMYVHCTIIIDKNVNVRTCVHMSLPHQSK